MFQRFAFLILLLSTLTFDLFAQSTGCLIGNNVFTNLNGYLTVTVVVSVSVRNFDNPSLSTLSNACPRAANVTPVTGPATVSVCVANGNLLPLGSTVTYTRLESPVQCDLDDLTLPFAAAAGTLGLFFIRRRKVILNK
ncbi:hypothetical protein EV200_101254 [Pedobacter psychrotolerans]|uniref:Secreted protein with PEP-CTERM sorting signal n=1 Tax=Pedobacter psychrotolerans TaxID=1843235 RepID=A0A4R2HM52_9SPHI|nr:hypothetical protein [Pedobacter psychrotolerans]TCO30815.1 hypothetical protein EV200_101254 [Pedobacter psychrotolerans]GGE44277.1 hypothetical protein GCM10011413_07950 [Pedobacter psychrotolerans]